MEISIATIIGFILIGLAIVTFFKTIRIVPQSYVYIVERLGSFHKQLDSGFHILIPFIDRVAHIHTIKEQVIDSDPQFCITKDNIEIGVDGVVYIQVIDPYKASYNITDYKSATIQLAQTTMRSIVGQTELDKTFEERETINREVTKALDEAAAPWGVKCLRYEVSDIKLPETIKDALEKQMRAERERRATITESEGKRLAMINVSEGQRQEIINLSEAEKQKQINEAEGRAKEIEMIAIATANGISSIAKAINDEGGKDAVSLRIAEQYVKEFGNLAKTNNTMIIPASLSDIGGTVAGLSEVLKQVNLTKK